MLLSPAGLLLSFSVGASKALGAHRVSLLPGWVLDPGESCSVWTGFLPGGCVHRAGCAGSTCCCQEAVFTRPELRLQGQHRSCGGVSSYRWRQLYLWTTCLHHWTPRSPFCPRACFCDLRPYWHCHPFIQQWYRLWVQQWDVCVRGGQRGRVHSFGWASDLWACFPPRETM